MGGQLAGLEVRHRSHARVEDRIRVGRATGLRNLPCRAYQQNQAWLELSLAAADLLTWPRRCASPANSPAASPPRFRYCITSVAGRLVRTGRRWQLRLDRDWPWPTWPQHSAGCAPPPGPPEPPASLPARPKDPEPAPPARQPVPLPARTRPEPPEAHLKINNARAHGRAKDRG
jgi:Transposase DDE domain group 1